VRIAEAHPLIGSPRFVGLSMALCGSAIYASWGRVSAIRAYYDYPDWAGKKVRGKKKGGLFDVEQASFRLL
jgi:hypothetical protein